MDVAQSQVQRIREWVFGNYSIETGTGKGAVKINVAASIGLAQWERGATMQQVMEQADAAMYLDKQMSGAKRA
jgi:GGDEF domain-containing protein